MDLRLRTHESGGAVVVEVRGEVELHSAPQLREELHRVCTGGACVVVDLTGVSFIDSTGLGVLIGGLKRARESGSLSIVCPQSRVRRVFEITGLMQVFTFYDALEDAVASCNGRSAATNASDSTEKPQGAESHGAKPPSAPGSDVDDA